jgi:hypothetical protein
MTGWTAAGIAGLVILILVLLVSRLASPRERYRGVVATGISPVGAVDHVEAAVRRLDGYAVERDNDGLVITRIVAVSPATPLAESFQDVLNVHATRMEVGTRVDIWGFADPIAIAAIRDSLARTPAWTRAL